MKPKTYIPFLLLGLIALKFQPHCHGQSSSSTSSGEPSAGTVNGQIVVGTVLIVVGEIARRVPWEQLSNAVKEAMASPDGRPETKLVIEPLESESQMVIAKADLRIIAKQSQTIKLVGTVTEKAEVSSTARFAIDLTKIKLVTNPKSQKPEIKFPKPTVLSIDDKEWKQSTEYTGFRQHFGSDTQKALAGQIREEINAKSTKEAEALIDKVEKQFLDAAIAHIQSERLDLPIAGR